MDDEGLIDEYNYYSKEAMDNDIEIFIPKSSIMKVGEYSYSYLIFFIPKDIFRIYFIYTLSPVNSYRIWRHATGLPN